MQQRWQFRVVGKLNDLAGTAKTLLYEMDLKVAELVLIGAAKHPVERDDALLPADALLTRQQKCCLVETQNVAVLPSGGEGNKRFWQRFWQRFL